MVRLGKVRVDNHRVLVRFFNFSVHTNDNGSGSDHRHRPALSNLGPIFIETTPH